MVKSQLNNDVIYKEGTDIDDEDEGYASTRYEYTYLKIPLEIVLGKEKYTYSKYDVIYYPVYLVINDELESKIGVFEVDSHQVINIIDEDGDMDLKKGNIIIYASEKYLKEITANKIISKESKEIVYDAKPPSESENNSDSDNNSDDEDITRLKIPKKENEVKNEKTAEKTAPKKDDGVFTENAEFVLPPLLPEENEVNSSQMKREYVASSKNNWVQQFTKNNNYGIIDNEGGGECFFAVIRDAFHQIGKETTVKKLRALLVPEVTDDFFRNSRTVYLRNLAEYQEKTKELATIKKSIAVLKQRIEKTTNKAQHSELLEDTKKVTENFKAVKNEKDFAKQLLDDYEYMENIDSLEKYKEFVLTAQCWADDWSINVIERLLNIKIIILSEESFDAGDLDSIMKCGMLSETESKTGDRARPDFYIITAHTGSHYKLITYKDKRIFTFPEIPYDVKILVINKCMERNAGPFSLIKDFKDYKNNLGVVISDEPLEDESLDKDLYDKDVVFSFYKDSNAKPKAGTGSGEKIPNVQLTTYTKLNSIKDWRKMLDDSWSAPFTMDGHRFNTIEHYVLGAQYKKGFPDFFLQFSLDSNSDISKDLELARAAASKSGKLKDKVLRNKTIKTDADYFEVGVNPRHIQERTTALNAKFSQNLDLKQALIETQNAKLVHFLRGKEPEMDELLMKLRKELGSTKK